MGIKISDYFGDPDVLLSMLLNKIQAHSEDKLGKFIMSSEVSFISINLVYQAEL
jgi:hypothetical protein